MTNYLVLLGIGIGGGGGWTPPASFRFGTIATSGETDVVADADPDTLTVVEGHGFGNTQDASADSLTFGLGVPIAMKHDANTRLIAPITADAVSTQLDVAANSLSGTFVYITKRTTFTRIGINVVAGGGAGSNCRLGIYKPTSNHQPGVLVLDAGEVDVSTTGVKEITISQALSPGIYWLMLANESGTVDLTRYGEGNQIPLLGYSTTNTRVSTLFRTGVTYGPLPSDESASVYSQSVTGVILVWLRVA